jgi:hypothetical protein
MIARRTILTAAATAAFIPKAKAQTPGVTATSIKIGNTTPYSGPASSYSVVGRTASAFFNMINDQGGVDGRKIEFISFDDGYSPPAQDRRADPPPRRARPGRLHLPDARHPNQLRHRRIHEPQRDTATIRRLRRQ